MGWLFVLGYLVWSGLLVWLYLWIGEALFWRRYDRERRAITNDQDLLLSALRRAARKDRNR